VSSASAIAAVSCRGEKGILNKRFVGFKWSSPTTGGEQYLETGILLARPARQLDAVDPRYHDARK
jgi:hypothetical protein